MAAAVHTAALFTAGCMVLARQGTLRALRVAAKRGCIWARDGVWVLWRGAVTRRFWENNRGL